MHATRPAASTLRLPEARWLQPLAPDVGLVASLASGLGLPRPLCALLAARGHTDVEGAKRFLRPDLARLHDPALLADGPLAAERIARAVRDGERVLVHGDYDVDGICATALLTRWLRRLGGDVMPFVPNRLHDGYDFSDAGLAAATASGATLVVTVDCGTVAHAPIARARAAGIDVVVTDHHTVGDELPPALAVVNPQRADCAYPEKGLCGTGLAYKLCALVAGALGVDAAPLVEYLDLVALATVADLVPLDGENRALVRYGLRRFATTRIVGIDALLEVAGVPPDDVTPGRLGFVVAPRINAAGRMGDPTDALRLLLTEDRAEANRLASAIDQVNARRREEDRRTLDEALEALELDYDPAADYGVVLASERWHPGVIGIVASRVVERIHRPVLLVALEGDRGRGSGRSIPGFHLYDAVAECAEHLTRFGGHKQAAGMDLDREALPALRTAFNAAARRRLAPEQLHPTLRPDLEIAPSEIDLQLVHWLGYLGPHGIGNPGPLFLSRGVALEGVRLVKERHLKAALARDGARIDGIGFGLAERFDPATLSGGPHDVLFRLERNEWRGTARPQARLVDLRPTA